MGRPTPPASDPAATGWQLRTLLLLSMLVPLLGATVLAGGTIRDRNAVRSASVDLERSAAELADQVRFVAALGQEEVHSSVLGLANTYGAQGLELEVDLDLVEARLAGARALVDREAFDDLRRSTDLDEGLADLRRRLDAGEAAYAEVSEYFSAIDAAVEDAWTKSMDAVARVSDQAPLAANLRREIRSLRATMTAFSESDDRVHHGLAILLQGPTPSHTEALVDATARFQSSVDAALDDAHATEAATWRRWENDPASRRTEDALVLAAAVGLGRQVAPAEVDPAALAEGLTDGARWGVLLADVVRAGATDLQQSASAQADASARAMAVQVAAVTLLSLVSISVVAVIARSITRPVRALEHAARRVEVGDFDLDAMEPHGPRELVATARAFNDMSATLAAMEGHAVALATDPSSPILEERLPGRTGEALQAALDRLRRSIADAEARRDELTELATRDGLTGLLNRGAAVAAVERDLARARRDGSALLALYIDLDGLKELNDTYGHAVGDEAIRRTAAALQRTTRDGDVVARLGGDEFLVAGPLPPDGRRGAETLAARLLDAVHAEVIEATDGSRHPLRCSIGAATSVDAATTVGRLVRAADAALYRAKQGGRHRVAWGDERVGLPG